MEEERLVVWGQLAHSWVVKVLHMVMGEIVLLMRHHFVRNSTCMLVCVVLLEAVQKCYCS